MTTSKKLLTADELLAMPDDGMRHELVRGELLTMAPAADRHGIVADRTGRRLGNFVEAGDLGHTWAADTGFWIERLPDTVRAPDYAFASHERLSGHVPERGYAEVIPDLVVEVASPNDRQPEINAKTQMWLDAGVRLVLNVYPETQEIYAHHHDGTMQRFGVDDTLSGDPVLPGFSCTVGDIFIY